MYILHIEHAVPDFDRWKKAFDDDPVGRERSGVRSYVVTRPVDDPRYAIVDLRFDSREEADKMLAALQVLWNRVQGTVMTGPQTRILQVVESRKTNVAEGGAP